MLAKYQLTTGPQHSADFRQGRLSIRDGAQAEGHQNRIKSLVWQGHVFR
jgi:hypothetical protein